MADAAKVKTIIQYAPEANFSALEINFEAPTYAPAEPTGRIQSTIVLAGGTEYALRLPPNLTALQYLGVFNLATGATADANSVEFVWAYVDAQGNETINRAGIVPGGMVTLTGPISPTANLLFTASGVATSRTKVAVVMIGKEATTP